MYWYSNHGPAPGLSQAWVRSDPPGDADDEKKNFQWVGGGSEREINRDVCVCVFYRDGEESVCMCVRERERERWFKESAKDDWRCVCDECIDPPIRPTNR